MSFNYKQQTIATRGQRMLTTQQHFPSNGLITHVRSKLDPRILHAHMRKRDRTLSHAGARLKPF